MHIGTICQSIFDSTKDVMEQTGDDLKAAAHTARRMSAQIEEISTSDLENLEGLKARLSESLFFRLEQLVGTHRFEGESAQVIARQVGYDCEMWAKRLCCLGNYLLVGESLDDVYHAIHDNSGKCATIADLVKVELTLISSWVIGDLIILLCGESLLVLGLVAATYIGIHELLDSVDKHIKQEHKWR